MSTCKRMHRPTTPPETQAVHIPYTRVFRIPGPTRARPAIVAISPRTDATPPLPPATSSAKMMKKAHALLATEMSQMPAIFFSPHELRAQPSSPGELEACGTTYRQRTREAR